MADSNQNNENIFKNNKSTHENPFIHQSKDNNNNPFDDADYIKTTDVFENPFANDNNNNNNVNQEENNIEPNPFEENNNSLPSYEKFQKQNSSNINNNSFNNSNQMNNNQNNNNPFNNSNQMNNPFNNNNNQNNNFPYNNSNQMNNNQNNNFPSNPGNNYNNNQGAEFNPYDLDQPNPSPNNVFPMGNNNNNFPNNNQNNNRYDHDLKKIKDIISRCELLYNQARSLYDNYDIKKAISNTSNAIKGLDGLKQSIMNNKTQFSPMLPDIVSLRFKIFKDLLKYRLTIYQLIPRKFMPIRYNGAETLTDFVKRYLLCEPFVSFDDIYDPNPDNNYKIKFIMNDYFQKSQRLGYRNLLLFGPNGSGKTLAVHALANHLKGKVAQLEGVELFKIPNFSLEFVKVAFNYQQFKPLIIYIRNIEKMFSNMNNFNFIYDKACSSKIKDVILIASTSIIDKQLPKDVSKKFHYTYCIRPCEKNQKANLIKFICYKIGINLNVMDKDLNELAYQGLRNYSNEDIFKLIVAAVDLKKNKMGNSDDNMEMIYRDGINFEELKNAMDIVKGSITPAVMSNYYL